MATLTAIGCETHFRDAGVLSEIGNTPLLRLRNVVRDLDKPGVEIYAKAEWFNPGGSVKDRAALRIIEDAERSGTLEESCGDLIDNDCDTVVDNRDADQDGSVDEACGGGDCDDEDDSIHPGADEDETNGLDDDCDGETDESSDDLDGDGESELLFGVPLDDAGGELSGALYMVPGPVTGGTAEISVTQVGEEGSRFPPRHAQRGDTKQTRPANKRKRNFSYCGI